MVKANPEPFYEADFWLFGVHIGYVNGSGFALTILFILVKANPEPFT